MEIHSFSVPMRSVGGYLEPDIDDNLDYTCDFNGNSFMVKVTNINIGGEKNSLSKERLDILKAKYSFVGTEIKDDIVYTSPVSLAEGL